MIRRPSGGGGGGGGGGGLIIVFLFQSDKNSGTGCWKLMTSLVNVSLIFQT